MFLLFLCLTIAYGMRVNLSVAIVAMTNRKSANEDFEVISNFFVVAILANFNFNIGRTSIGTSQRNRSC